MVWFIEVRKHKDGYYTRCAESDEGGGFVEGCQHKHSTREEASACREAEEKCRLAAGFGPLPTLDKVAAQVPDAKPGWSPTDKELTEIYKQANNELVGKAYPITTEKIFAAMRAMVEKTKTHWNIQ